MKLKMGETWAGERTSSTEYEMWCGEELSGLTWAGLEVDVKSKVRSGRHMGEPDARHDRINNCVYISVVNNGK